MQQGRDEGIILRYSGQNISLLSRNRGRIDALLFYKKGPCKVSCGSILSYSLAQSKYGRLIIENNMTEHTPLLWAQQDIYFLHYLLEACYFFMPVGSGGRFIFTLLERVYRNFQVFETIGLKKLLLCKLFAHLGVCPEHKKFQLAMEHLLEIDVDNIGPTDLELVQEETLDDWVRWCICLHPQGKWFKAMPTLLKSE